MTHTSPEQPYIAGAGAEHTWSATFNIQPQLSTHDIIGQLGTLVTAYADPYRPISGAIVGLGLAKRDKLVLGLDPSNTFGTPSVEVGDEIATDISREFGWQKVANDPFSLRTVMGRRVGYASGAKVHTPIATYLAIAEHQSHATTHVNADLFSLRHVPGEGLRSYTEPGVIINSPINSTPNIAKIAQALGQVRFVTESSRGGTRAYYRPS